MEIAARFVLDGTPNAALIEKAKLVYQTGLSKFPSSHIVLQAYHNKRDNTLLIEIIKNDIIIISFIIVRYASFMLTTVGDWQLGCIFVHSFQLLIMIFDY